MFKKALFSVLCVVLIVIPVFAQDNAASSSDGGLTSALSTGIGIGAVTINGELYNQIAFRPSFNIGKLSMGLDVAVYINGDGQISSHNWDDFDDYLNMLYYVSWATKYDPFYVRLGGLDQVSLVNGILIDRYTNMLEYPAKKHFGTELGIQKGRLGFYGFISDWAEMDGVSGLPGLCGARLSFGNFVEVGASIVADLNPYNAFKEDTDDDGYSDLMDFYPNQGQYHVDTDGDGIPDAADLDVDGDNLWEYRAVDGLTQAVLDSFIAPMFPSYDGYERLDTVTVLDMPTIDTLMVSHPTVFSASADITIPLIRKSGFSLELYSVGAVLGYLDGSTQLSTLTKDDVFIGASPFGIGMTISDFLTAKVEYRWAQENFQYGFFDRNYDLNRVYFVQDENNGFIAKTKYDQILDMNIPAAQGYYGSVGINIANFFTLDCSYMNMISGVSESLQTFQIEATVPPETIPMVSEVNAYYHRNNDANPFAFKSPSERTVMGACVGMDLGGGVSIVYNYMMTYRDKNGDSAIDPKEERITVMNVETGFTF